MIIDDERLRNGASAMGVETKRADSFTTLLKRHRIAAGFSQTSLAKALGVAPSAVSMWESGTSLPSATRIPFLASLLRVDAMQLTYAIAPDPQAPAEREGW